ncbi:lysozyme inhibitor LprI family protein [Aliiroseovarius crassostreae]|uniref:lysozyme inhibitor LprI family protein n=1 Tax=Aliiroseovarius crassostreae TaxID=154981 RepID=UPI003C7C0F0F
MNRWAAIFALTCAGAPALAQDVTYSFDATVTCLAEKGDSGEAHQCFGAAANACMESTEYGWSTAGMVQCLDAEVNDWDRRLNTAYGLLMKHSKAIDAEMAELGSSAPSQAEALRKMQRAWIPFRDASCEYERSTWGGGTGGGPASLSCYLHLTAQQAWSLEQNLAADEAATCNHEGCTE